VDQQWKRYQFFHSKKLRWLRWHFTRTAVPLPFEIPILEKGDGKHRSFLEWKNRYLFIDPQRTKVDQNCYIDILKTSLLPECRWLYPGIDFVFMQDSAPSYRAKVTQEFLWQNNPDFIAADEWTSFYSPDLNPLDYCIWDILQNLVYEGLRLPFANLQDLKEAIKNKWKKVTIETARKSIAQWKNDCMRLESRMEARFSTFSANRYDWIVDIDLVQWDVLNLVVILTFRIPNILLRILLLKQKCIKS